MFSSISGASGALNVFCLCVAAGRGGGGGRVVLRCVDVDGLAPAGVHTVLVGRERLLVHHPVDLCEDLRERVVDISGVQG